MSGELRPKLSFKVGDRFVLRHAGKYAQPDGVAEVVRVGSKYAYVTTNGSGREYRLDMSTTSGQIRQDARLTLPEIDAYVAKVKAAWLILAEYGFVIEQWRSDVRDGDLFAVADLLVSRDPATD